MKKYIYYLTIFICLFFALFFYKQRGVFLPILNAGAFSQEEAVILEVNKDIMNSTIKIEYTYNDEIHYGELYYSEGDDNGKKVYVSVYKSNKYIQRIGFVKRFDIFSIILLFIVFLLLIGIFLTIRYKYGFYKNKLYYISYGFHFVFLRGVYAAARGSNIEFLIYIFLVWLQAIVVISYIAKKNELRERNTELLKQYSVKQDDNIYQ